MRDPVLAPTPLVRAVLGPALGTLVCFAAGGCVATDSTAPTGVLGSDAAGAPFEAELVFCMEETNRYRALAGHPPLTRSKALEAYAAEAARTDALARTTHHHARSTGFGGGLVRAENQIPFWPLSQFRTVRTVIDHGLAQMWAQGESGAHYRNMMGRYAEIGCGVFVDGDEVTVVQAFR